MSKSIIILLVLYCILVHNSDGKTCLVKNNCFPPPNGQTYKCSGYSSADLKVWKKKYENMVRGGKAVGYKQAAANLQHFLDGKGTQLSMSKSFLLGYRAVKNRMADNMKKIMCGVHKRGKALSVGKTKTEEICYCASNYARFLSDLYFASGGFTIGTSVNAYIKRVDKDKIEYKLTKVEHTFYDPYNWEAAKGLTAYVPGIGSVPDAAAYCLEKNGMGKSYIMKTTWSAGDKSGTLYVNGDCKGNKKTGRFIWKRQDVGGPEVLLVAELVEFMGLVLCVSLFCCIGGGVLGFVVGKKMNLLK